MRRLWLLLAFAILVVIDLSILPTLVLAVFAGSLLTAGSHQGGSFLPAMAIAVMFGAMFIGLTYVVGRAWRKAPRPSRSD
jgi:membrane protein implicated in regulation of membrane protease activity